MSMDTPEAGLQVLHAAFTRDLFAEVIVMTAFGNVANAVECMRRGAFDYIEKNAPGVDAYEAALREARPSDGPTSPRRAHHRPLGAQYEGRGHGRLGSGGESRRFGTLDHPAQTPGERFYREGTVEKVALALRASQRSNLVKLLGGLHALARDVQA